MVILAYSVKLLWTKHQLDPCSCQSNGALLNDHIANSRPLMPLVLRPVFSLYPQFLLCSVNKTFHCTYYESIFLFQ